MAAVILGARSFDCGNSQLNTIDRASADVYASAGHGHTGTYGLRLRITNDWARWALAGTPNNPSLSIWYYPGNDAWNHDGTGFNYMNLRFHLVSGEYIDLRWDATNKTFDAYVDGAKVADGTVSVDVQDWFHIQFYVEVANAGEINVLINGHSSITYSGDTQPGGTDTVDYVYVCGQGVSPCYVDDVVFGYGGYLGDLRCVDIRPNADTAQDDWTPSVGDNYSTVDETPENDADYNETNTNGHADELALGDFDDTLMTPRAVVAYVRARMEGAFGDSLKVGIVSNAVEVTTTHALSTAYEYYTHTADEDPNGPIAWTDAAVDSLLLRYEAAIA